MEMVLGQGYHIHKEETYWFLSLTQNLRIIRVEQCSETEVNNKSILIT